MSLVSLPAARTAAVLALSVCLTAGVEACPFCTALRPTLTQRREAAAVVALAECTAAEKGIVSFRLHRVVQGSEMLAGQKSLDLPIRDSLKSESLKSGSLLILFGDGEPAKPLAQWSWNIERTNEAGLAYFAQAPSLKMDAAERLRYFARFLEHSEPLIAEDAYNEFGHADYDIVVQVADLFSSVKLRNWLTDERVQPQRKGFYGLALGLAGPNDQREVNRRFLERLALQPANDFRAGFDGVLAGYLISAGPAALDQIEARFLANSAAADGDVRHVVSALRFYQEFGRDIPQKRLSEALRHLLARPEFAAAVIVDLARWQDWSPVEQIAGMYADNPPPSPAIRRAIVGYLLTCPLPAAREQLSKLRQFDPRGVDAFARSYDLSDTAQ